MIDLKKIYANIFNKSFKLTQGNSSKLKETDYTGYWQKLEQLNQDMEKLPMDIQYYIAYLCSFYKRATPVEDADFDLVNLDATLKKICEIYAIGLLVCDDLLTRIIFLNTNKKANKIIIPTINYNNVCQYLTWLTTLLLQTTGQPDTNHFFIQLTEEDIATINCYSKLLTTAYNSCSLGIFRKQPLRHFKAEEMIVTA